MNSRGTPSTGAYLGIDAGGSSTRWLLVDGAGSTLAAGTAAPLSAIQLRSGDAAVALANLERVALDASATAAPARVVASVTGLGSDPEDTFTLQAALATALSLPLASVKVIPDVHAAYLSALRPGEGVLVYAGTGSIAVHLRPDGSEVRAGGHGYLIDDAGAGYWIGREALQLVLRRADALGVPPDGALAAGVYAALGGSDWDSVRAAVYGGGRAKVASLTRVVAVAAAGGDGDAAHILVRAGEELAKLATTLMTRLQATLPVVLAGGVVKAGASLTDAVRANLPARASFGVSDREPVEAAAELSRAGW